MIKLVALLIDLETKELQRAAKTIVLENPSISILVRTTHSVVSAIGPNLNNVNMVPLQVLNDPKVGQHVLVKAILQNPLPESLENCVFSLHGANLTGGTAITKE